MAAPKPLLVLGSVLSVALSAGMAHADATLQACSDSYSKGQEERLAGRLFNAREQFEICAAATCPGAVVGDCKRWLSEVEADLPTASIRVTDTAGRVPEGLTVFLDGQSVPLSALSKPLVMNAGPHVLRFDAPGFETLELSPALRPEDRALPVNALLRLKPAAPPTPLPEAPAAAEPAHHAAPVAAITFAALGAVALGGSIYFGLSAKSRYDDLKIECAPHCAQSQVDAVHSKAVVSDVALATSVVALGAAAWFYFSAQPDEPGSTAIGIEPAPLGARARLRVAF